MPAILLRDPTLVERLRNMQKVPSDYFDDVINELIKRAETAGKPTIKGLDSLPQLVAQEVMRALDGKLAEAIRAALLPAVSDVVLEVPVELSVRVRLRLEPVLEFQSNTPTHDNHDDPPAADGNGSLSAPVAVGDVLSDKTRRTLELAALEQRVIEFLRQQGGCFEGSVGDLLRTLGIEDPKRSLRYRLYSHLYIKGGKVCLPEAAVK